MNKAAFFLFSLLLAYGLFRPEPPPDLFYESDKFFHVGAFGVLALLSRMAFPSVPGWLMWGLLIAQAPFLEWMQHELQASRDFDYEDIIANLCGVSGAFVVWCFRNVVWRRVEALLR